MIVKVCGLAHPDNIRQVAALGPDWLGLIFAPRSPRCVPRGALPFDAEEAEPHKPLRVGVFVDADAMELTMRIVGCQLDLLQLHGHESPAYVTNVRRVMRVLRPELRVIKAFGIEREEDLEQCTQYEGLADYFLFDTKCSTDGGSGRSFAWDVLQAYRGSTPFLLSGGIGPGDAGRIKAFHHPQCVGIDLNSRFETAPAMKDVEALRSFLKELRS